MSYRRRFETTALLVAALAITVTACGEDLSSEGSPFTDQALFDAEAPEVFELAVTGTQTVYVNFDGVRVSDCGNYCSDATIDSSWAIGAHWGVASVNFAPFGGGSAARNEIVASLERGFADYDVVFTTTRPSSGPYTMLIVSPTSGSNHGVAPLDCENRNPSDIAFVYRIGNSSTGWIAQAGGHELGHSFGLSHVVASRDYMQWASSGDEFTVSNYDEGHPSGKCFDGPTQDGPGLLLAALGGFSAQPEPFDGRFADDDGSVHEADIELLASSGITVGCAGGDRPKFCPKQAVTRGQMVVFLQRGLGLGVSAVDHFDDDDGAWFEQAANAAADVGITQGCGARQFCGNDPITRAQMAAFLARAFSYPAATEDFFDDDAGSIFEGDINSIATVGVTVGCGTRRYCPDDPVTREQMASFLVRALGL